MVSQAVVTLSGSESSETSMSDASVAVAAPSDSEEPELPVDMSLASMVGGIYQVPSTASVASFPSDSDMSECSMVFQAVAVLPGSESSESSMSEASVVGGILSVQPTQLAEAQSVMTMYTDSDMDLCSLASSHYVPMEDSQSEVSLTQYLPPIEHSESDLMVATSEASPQVNSSVDSTVNKSICSEVSDPYSLYCNSC